ncbi:MAG TPA: hypothetical protein VKY59_03305 [Spirillospora sp.]|nr:hypothetical protein [Spirillospora sp.]
MDENQNPVENNTVNSTDQTETTPPVESSADDDRMQDRLERLGGEPAPVITPEEFARLQQAGQVHIDARGRVRTARRSDAEAGVSLRKRRAWYGAE